MKTVLISAAALGAALLASPAAAQTADGWTGFYVGGQLGGAFSSDRSSETVLFDKNLDGQFGDTVLTAANANAFSPGFCGGSAKTSLPAGGCKGDSDGVRYAIHAGYDWRKPGTPYVFGAVAEIGKSNVSDAVTAYSTTPAFYTLQRREDFEIGLRARVGRLFYGEKTLVFVTGGAAYAEIKNSFSTSNTANRFTNNGDEGDWGYKVGAGVEHRLTPKISVGLQYIFTSIDADGYRVRASNTGATPATNPFLIANTGGTDFRRSESEFANHSISATLNYRF